MTKEIDKALYKTPQIKCISINKSRIDTKIFDNVLLGANEHEGTQVQAKDGKYNYNIRLYSEHKTELSPMDKLLMQSIQTLIEHIEPSKDGKKSFTLKNLYNTMIFEQANKRRLSEKQEQELIIRLRELSNVEMLINIDSKDEQDEKLATFIDLNRHKIFEYSKLLHLRILYDRRNENTTSYVTLLEDPLYFQALGLNNRRTMKKSELLTTPSIKRYTDTVKLVKSQLISDIERHKSNPRRQHSRNNLSRYYELVGATTSKQKQSVRETIQTILMDFEDNGYITLPVPRKALKHGNKSIFTKDKTGAFISFEFTGIAPNDTSYHIKSKNK